MTAVSTNLDVVAAAKEPEQQRNKIAMTIEIFLFLKIKVLVQRYLHKYTKVKKCITNFVLLKSATLHFLTLLFLTF